MAEKNTSELIRKPSPETARLPPSENRTAALKELGGSNSDDFNNALANQVVNALWLATEPEAREKQFHAALAILIGIKPSDEIEGMLAAQLIATHHAAMECFRQSMLKEQTVERRRENLNIANKLVRSYATLIEALNRHRGKGQQRVTVEHVHVYQGGQAIVGAVQEGRGARKSEEQPCATRAIIHEPDTPMRGSIPEREAVLSTYDAQQAAL
jgi:hypothetical protein